MKTVVFVRGGVVQGVITDHKSEVLIVDYDTNGEDEGLLRIEGNPANVWLETEGGANLTPVKVQEIFSKYKNHQTKKKLRGSFRI